MLSVGRRAIINRKVTDLESSKCLTSCSSRLSSHGGLTLSSSKYCDSDLADSKYVAHFKSGQK